MALTRKFLAAMGIEPEKIDEIISAHTESIDAVKEDRDKYKAQAEKYKENWDSLKPVQKELDELKAATEGRTPFKTEYEKAKAECESVRSEFDKFKANIEAEKKKSEKMDAYKKLLADVGVSEKRIAAIMKLSGDAINELEFDEKGAVKDTEKLKEKIKENWSEFIQVQEKQGAQTATPPMVNGVTGKTGTGIAAQLAAQYDAEHYGAPKTKEG